MIDENNFKQAVLEYAMETYGTRLAEFLEKFHHEFPEKDQEIEGDLGLKNFFDWLFIEKPLPDTGKTIVEEFVEAHPGLDKTLREKMLQMKNVIRSRFRILSKEGLRLRLEDIVSGKEYTMRLYTDEQRLKEGIIIEGRIHPFGDEHRFCGIFTFSVPSSFLPSPEDFMDFWEAGEVRNAENIVLHENSPLASILNKYPFQWVDGICKALSLGTGGRKGEKAKMAVAALQDGVPAVVAKLPERSRKALAVVLDGGGFVKAGVLKDFEDDIGYWWADHPPRSELGVLRLYGLLAIGKMPIGGRLYAVALIPADLREPVRKALEDMNEKSGT